MSKADLHEEAAARQTNSYARNVNRPSYCTEDPANVNPCEDVDSPPEFFSECRHVCSGELCWQASTHDIIPSPSDSAHSTQFRTKSYERSSFENKRSPLSLLCSQGKSTESVYLDETPKLRRGMAYMDFEDGDCEPDHCLKFSGMRWNAPDCGLGDKKLDSNSNERGIGRLHWRVRKGRLLKQGPFSRFTKKDPIHSTDLSSIETKKRGAEAANGINAFIYEHTEEWAMEHLPSGDLFHQFGSVHNNSNRVTNSVGRHHC